jgi:hypothetical protein
MGVALYGPIKGWAVFGDLVQSGLMAISAVFLGTY